MPNDDQNAQQPAGQDQNPPEGQGTREEGNGAQNGAEGRESAPERESAIRKRAQDAEAARDALTARVEKMQRREVEALADKLHDPADLWARVQLADLLGDDGDVDTEKVALAISALIDSKPYLAKPDESERPKTRGPGFGQGNGHATAPPEPAGWSQVFTG